ncbi:sporulation-specific protein 22 [Metarhizium acridum]|uniref:sporulation-specific protein 22 n=1 Tax=Metarhizium acridum TaxID=92637 RepID=UPI001C6AD5D7|nr:sporulation-specific protein 22 [Metarhizium acridum]
MTTLLVYDFEAAVSLGQFEDLQTIIGNLKLHKDLQAFKCLGDILLQYPIPVQVLTATLKTIINEIYRLEQFNAAKLCKYLRVILQITVSVNDTTALQIISQIIKVAHESREASTLLPRTDVEWIAAITFNHAIDYYARSEETPCRVWAAKSMELAEYLDDNGRLAKTMRDRFGQLRFENETMFMADG